MRKRLLTKAAITHSEGERRTTKEERKSHVEGREEDAIALDGDAPTTQREPAARG
jgi:hypothetical protein